MLRLFVSVLHVLIHSHTNASVMIIRSICSLSITCTFALAYCSAKPHNLWFDERRLRLIHYAWNVVISLLYTVANSQCAFYSSRKSVVVFRATTDNFRTNNLSFYFANVSTESYVHKHRKHKCFLTHLKKFILCQLCVSNEKYISPLCSHTTRVKTP